MSISTTLTRAAKATQAVTVALHERPLPATLRNRVGIALLGISIDHQNAIVELLRRPQPIQSSAMALVRPTLESFVRGTWAIFCATDQQVEAFSKDGSPPDMASLVRALDKHVFTEKQKIQPIYKDFWARMCSFTHSGGLQVQRWNTDAAIEPAYDESELIEAITFVTAIAIQAGTFIASQLNNKAVVEKLLNAAHEFATE